MIWLGVVIGLCVAGYLKSLSAFVVLGAIGALVAYGFRRAALATHQTMREQKRLDAEGSQRHAALRQQLLQMHERIELLERQLRAGGMAAAPDAAPTESLAAPTAIDSAATTKAATAADAADAATTTAQVARPVRPAPTPTSDALPAIPVANANQPLPSATPADQASATPADTIESNTRPPVEANATTPASAPAPAPSATTAPAMPHPATPATASTPRAARQTARPAPPPAEPSWLQIQFQRWIIGGNPLVKIGVLILFLGLAFLLRYAAEHAVLPVEYRYAGVATSGIALLLLGWRWRLRKDNYGLMLQGLGVGVLYLTTLAAMKLHPLIPPSFGFAILLAVAVFSALLAVLQNALPLAVIGTLGGFAAPVLASTGHGNHVMLFSYMTLLNLGVLGIAWFKAWRPLNLVGFSCTFALAGAWASNGYRDELFASTEPFLLLFFVVYLAITVLFARRTLADAPTPADLSYGAQIRLAAARVPYVDASLAFGVPLLTFGLQCMLVRPWQYGAAFSALGFGLTYLLLAFALLRRGGPRYLLLNETLLALGVVFASLAIPLGLEPRWTASAWALEAAGMFWIGLRQRRWHARLFALLLLGGAALYFGLDLQWDDSGRAVLDGSVPGALLLATGALAMWQLIRRAQREPDSPVSAFENAILAPLLAGGLLGAATVPFLLWPMHWATPALALLATLAIFGGQRQQVRQLSYWGWAYQAVAGALFLSTMHSGASDVALSSSWSGLLAAGLIGASMLAGVVAVVRGLAAGTAAGAAPAQVSGVASLALLAGLAFLNLAPLFVLRWEHAAMLWPVTALATLWWAVHARHRATLAFALLLQVIAGTAQLGSRVLSLFGGASPELTPFLHSGFWGPLLIALASLLGARLLQRAAPTPRDRAQDETATQPRLPATLPGAAALGWISLAWAGLWWAGAWSLELARLLDTPALTAALVGIAVVSVCAMSAAARRWHWPQLGSATLCYLPVLTLISAILLPDGGGHPMASWGALAWPLALLMHALLLRRQPAWVGTLAQQLTHIGGAWLFVLLAAAELRWRFAGLGEAGGAWPLLGWMIAPVAYLWALCSPALRRRWPLDAQPYAYRVVSALPMALYLLGWIWLSNALSSGAALPLPYFPIVNPLELAQLAAWLGIALWWHTLRNEKTYAATRPQAQLLGGLTLLAMLTGMVLRTCHHWAGVPWDMQALLASMLVQSALSLSWAAVAIGLMLAGNRRHHRGVWIAGAALVGVVVAKLFLVELAASGSLARIISFIVVGLLLLLVGYFAPLPPRRGAAAVDTPAADSTAPDSPLA